MIDTNDQAIIQQVLNSYAKENEQLIETLIQLRYYSRGALSRDDVYAMTPVEREKEIEFLSKRFDEVRDMMKHKVPVFY